MSDLRSHYGGGAVGGLGAWQVDHAHPLWLVDRDAPGAIQYWGLENLQTLCPKCHQKKTASEATAAKKIRRAQERRGVRRKKTSIADLPF